MSVVSNENTFSGVRSIHCIIPTVRNASFFGSVVRGMCPRTMPLGKAMRGSMNGRSTWSTLDVEYESVTSSRCLVNPTS